MGDFFLACDHYLYNSKKEKNMQEDILMKENFADREKRSNFVLSNKR